jgi:hypothetical protein
MPKPMIPALVLLASAALVTLTGCTGSAETTADRPTASASEEPTPTPTSEGQTVEEACLIANEAVLSVQSEANAALANPSDQAAVMSALETIETRLAEAVGQISNSDVGSQLGAFQTQFAAFTDQLVAAQTAAPTTEQITALQTAATDLQTSAEEMRQLCT